MECQYNYFYLSGWIDKRFYVKMRLVLMCYMSFVLCSLQTAIASNNIPAQEPLTEADKREILTRLNELRVARQELELQRQHIARDEAQDKREADLHARELDLARQRQSLTEQELSIWKEKATSFELAYQTVLKAGRKGFGCKLKKLVTFGLASCR